jgi:hypothetical protein
MTHDRAAELRAAFDRGFAEAPGGLAPERVELLRIRLADAAYAIPLSAIASIHVDLHVEPIPRTSDDLLGVAVVRGAIIPIFDLRRLAGASTDAKPRWVVLASGRGFAFDGFDGLVRATGRTDPVIDLVAMARSIKER